MLNIYRQKRLEKKLKQTEIEKLTGIKQIRISHIERGVIPNEKERTLLNIALGISDKNEAQ